MEDAEYIQERLDRLYAELGELKRYLIVHLPAERAQNETAWQRLFEASEEISARWTGPAAVEEIREQREKSA